MGKRGPAPKPTAQRRLEGNPSKRPMNSAEPMPDPKKPPAPKWLRGEGRREWNRVARRLNEVGLLTYVDRATLAMYCDAWGEYVEARDKVEKLGTVIKTTKGNLIQNPYYSIKNQAMKQCQQLARELGMTPSARSGLRVMVPEQERSLAEELFAAINGV